MGMLQKDDLPDLLEQCHKVVGLYREQVNAICNRGEIAVIFAGNDTESRQTAIVLGCVPPSFVWAMSEEKKEEMIGAMEETGDLVTTKWLRGFGYRGRVFMICAGCGTLLLNVKTDGSIELEPGSYGDVNWKYLQKTMA